ncbi:hypothetical protein QTN25_010200 [Entamoeba marina]
MQTPAIDKESQRIGLMVSLKEMELDDYLESLHLYAKRAYRIIKPQLDHYKMLESNYKYSIRKWRLYGDPELDVYEIPKGTTFYLREVEPNSMNKLDIIKIDSTDQMSFFAAKFSRYGYEFNKIRYMGKCNVEEVTHNFGSNLGSKDFGFDFFDEAVRLRSDGNCFTYFGVKCDMYYLFCFGTS